MNTDQLQDDVNAAYKAVYQAERDMFREKTPKAQEAYHGARAAAAIAEHKLEEALDQHVDDSWATRELQHFTNDQLLAEIRRRMKYRELS